MLRLAPPFSGQKPRFQAIPMGAGPVRRLAPQRLEEPELLVSVAPLAQAVRQPVQSLARFAVARQQRLQRLDFRGLARAGHRTIGLVGKHDPPLDIRDQRAVGLAGKETAGERIALRLRHHLDKTDDGGDDEEDAHHRQDAEHTQHHLIVELVAEEDESRRGCDEHKSEQQDAQHHTGATAAIDQGAVSISIELLSCH